MGLVPASSCQLVVTPLYGLNRLVGNVVSIGVGEDKSWLNVEIFFNIMVHFLFSLFSLSCYVLCLFFYVLVSFFFVMSSSYLLMASCARPYVALSHSVTQ